MCLCGFKAKQQQFGVFYLKVTSLFELTRLFYLFYLYSTTLHQLLMIIDQISHRVKHRILLNTDIEVWPIRSF